jgi:hypothetical protein
MDMFNAKRRDILDMDSYMDLKNPGFGGPASAIKSSELGKEKKLNGYRKVVKRDPMFGDHYDSTYKAMTHDLVYKQEGEKPFDYDHEMMGIPVVDLEDAMERKAAKKLKSKMNEGKAYSRFTQFVNEQEMPEQEYSSEELATGANPLGMKEYDVKPMSWEKIEAMSDEDEDEYLEDDFADDDDEDTSSNYSTDREPSAAEIREIERLLLGGEEGDEDEDYFEDEF